MHSKEGQFSNEKISLVLVLLVLITIALGRIFSFEYGGFTIKPVYFASFALILYFFYQVLAKKVEIKIDFTEAILYLFIAFSFLSMIWSIDTKKTLIYSSMMLFMAFIFSAVRRMAKTKYLNFYLNFIVWLGVLTALFGLWQFFADIIGFSEKYTLLSYIYTKNIFGFPRVQSTFFEPGFYSNFLLIPLFLNIYNILKGKYLYIVCYGITLLAFFLTLSRGGFYSFGIALIILTIFILFKFRNYTKKLLLVFVLSAIVYFSGSEIIFRVSGSRGFYNFKSQLVKIDDFVKYNGAESEVGVTRSYTIKVALNNWKEKPFGIGSGSFGSLPEFEEIRKQGNLRQTVNSIYPEILVEQGIQGLALFLLFAGSVLWLLFKLVFRNTSFLGLILLCALLGMFIQFISFSTLYLVNVWVFLGLALAYFDSQSLINKKGI